MSTFCREIVIHTSVSHLLQQQRNDQEFCDVTLKAGNETFNAHRCVLAAVSDYFLKMFTTDMKEKYSQVIPIQTVTANALREILNCIYTGKIVLSEENLTDILLAASMMQIDNVLTTVKKYMRETLSVSNCFFFKKLATLYSLHELVESIDKFFVQNIVEISNEDPFLELPLNDVEELLKSDYLNVNDENIAFEILLKWVNKDVDERQQHFPQLFNHVRLQFIPIKQVVEIIAKNKLVRNVHECRDLIDEAVSFYFDPRAEASQKPRNCFASDPDSLLCIPYQSTTQTSYNLTSNNYSGFCFNDEACIFEDCGIANNHPNTFFCGGIDSNRSACKQQVLKFDGIQWMTLPSLKKARCGAAAVFQGSKLYVFGGESTPVSRDATFCGNKTTNPSFFHFANSFETLNESWEETNNGSQVRSYFSAQAINGKIHLIGGYKPYIANTYGYTHKHKVVCRDTIIYFPGEDTWKVSGQLNVARAAFGCAVHQSSIYVVGGYSDYSVIASIEFKNYHDVTWTLCSSSLANGGPKSICFVRKRMFVASKSFPDKVTAYELKENDVKKVDDSEIESKNSAGNIIPFAEKFCCSRFHTNPTSYVLRETIYKLSK